MNKISGRMVTLCIILIFLSPQLYAAGDRPEIRTGSERNYIIYSVSKNSWTSLSGTTNINSFECVSEAGISNGVILTDSGPGDDRIVFSDAHILMEVNSFDCKNPLINRDMYKALGGDQNPGIEVRLLEAYFSEGNLSSLNGNFIADAIITINGQSNTMELMIDWYRSEAMEYHFKGRTDIAMSEFGINPPSPAMGLIKVNDKITVHFNYIVQPSVISRLD
jgi:hypothetical protein